jgi:uncharacterized membrane protein
MKATRPASWLIRILWGLVVVLALIGIVAAVRRGLYLAEVIEPFVHPKYGEFDAGLAQYPLLTWLHIIPGFLFMVVGPLQFVKQIRSRFIWLHRWSGRVFVAASVVIGVTALVMSPLMAIGGANETTATIFFATIFLFALGKAFLHIRRRELAQHREWMIRTFAIGLAVATVRPLVGMFFALTNLSPQEFFGTAFWLGFTLHLVLAEIWINYTRPRSASRTRVKPEPG